jgi:hypothetical protein
MAQRLEDAAKLLKPHWPDFFAYYARPAVPRLTLRSVDSRSDFLYLQKRTGMGIFLTASLAATAISQMTGHLLPTTARVGLARIANPTPGRFPCSRGVRS